MTDDYIQKPGDYYRADYDPYLDQFTHLRPVWCNVNEYLKLDQTIAPDWYEKVRQGLKADNKLIDLGPVFKKLPNASVSVLRLEQSWARIDLLFDRECAAKTLMLCGVNKAEERAALNDFNSNARLKGGREADDWVRPYRIAYRPLAVALWMVDKDDANATISVTMALQAIFAAYFRLSWAA